MAYEIKLLDLIDIELDASFLKKALNSGTFVLPIHDYPARVEGGRAVARLGQSVPGPETPIEPVVPSGAPVVP